MLDMKNETNEITYNDKTLKTEVTASVTVDQCSKIQQVPDTKDSEVVVAEAPSSPQLQETCKNEEQVASTVHESISAEESIKEMEILPTEMEIREQGENELIIENKDQILLVEKEEVIDSTVTLPDAHTIDHEIKVENETVKEKEFKEEVKEEKDFKEEQKVNDGTKEADKLIVKEKVATLPAEVEERAPLAIDTPINKSPGAAAQTEEISHKEEAVKSEEKKDKLDEAAEIKQDLLIEQTDHLQLKAVDDNTSSQTLLKETQSVSVDGAKHDETKAAEKNVSSSKTILKPHTTEIKPETQQVK